ncbi:hypothetical protein Anapl_09128 [Anas platyrhynchos]|uniref:Uncharacterized protein n=1 Tax=Anas platyrhynchos TaxID=8839 RepID=R0JPF9_ANAPL|nr:hypothetical protein Anapl_09128 [Anas platyrhynchos]
MEKKWAARQMLPADSWMRRQDPSGNGGKCGATAGGRLPRYASQSQMQQEAFLRKKNPNLSATGSTEDLKLLEKVKLKSTCSTFRLAKHPSDVSCEMREAGEESMGGCRSQSLLQSGVGELPVATTKPAVIRMLVCHGGVSVFGLCTAWSEDAAFCLPGNAPCVLDSAGSKGTSGVSEDEALQRPFCALGDGKPSQVSLSCVSLCLLCSASDANVDTLSAQARPCHETKGISTCASKCVLLLGTKSLAKAPDSYAVGAVQKDSCCSLCVLPKHRHLPPSPNPLSAELEQQVKEALIRDQHSECLHCCRGHHYPYSQLLTPPRVA